MSNHSIELTSDLKSIRDNLPYVVKKQALFVPGVHNGVYYSADEVNQTFKSTNWNDKRVVSLYIDHKDDWQVDPRTGEKSVQGGASVGNYIGSVRNVQLDSGRIVGDLYIVDPNVAVKLAFEDTRWGISPAGHWSGSKFNAHDFQLRNFALVVNPAIKDNYIQNSALPLPLSGQMPYYNFAMSEAPAKDGEKTMDFEELKTELQETLKPIVEKVDALSTRIESMEKKDLEEEEPKPVEQAKKAPVKEPVPVVEGPADKKEDEEDMADLFIQNSENSAFTDFVKKGRADGKSMKEISDAWKKEKGEMDAKAMKELTDRISKLEGAAEVPCEDPKKKKEDEEPVEPKGQVEATTEAMATEMSSTAVNRGMADWLSGLGSGV